MGLVGVQGDGNGEMALSLGSKNKYKRMDSELSDDFEDDASHHHHQLERKKSTRKYVLACAIFASLNNVLLGYLSVAFVYKLVPETKGKSLEQIELLFQNHNEWDGSEMELGDAQHLVHKA
ncbi:hypothetical protein GOBAR_DD15840 [Gossypium barbadense]|nr:hypothetical protein GOBAR_DD15840 [Gossypium barbadense]